jgi:hypothetical protein
MPQGLRGWLRTAFFASWTWFVVYLLIFAGSEVSPPAWLRSASHAVLVLLPLLTVTALFFDWRLGLVFLMATLAAAAYVLGMPAALPL